MSLGQINHLPLSDIFIHTPDYSSSEGRPFRLGTGANMEKVVKMDRDMTKVHVVKRKTAILLDCFNWLLLNLLTDLNASVEWLLRGDHRRGLCGAEKGKQVGPVWSDSECRSACGDLSSGNCRRHHHW